MTMIGMLVVPGSMTCQSGRSGKTAAGLRTQMDWLPPRLTPMVGVTAVARTRSRPMASATRTAVPHRPPGESAGREDDREQRKEQERRWHGRAPNDDEEPQRPAHAHVGELLGGGINPYR